MDCPSYLLLCASGADIALRFRREQGFYAEAILISDQNVEIVRAMWEPFKGLDVTTIDWDTAIREIGQQISPEVELRWSATGPESRVYRGRDGVAQAFREWVEPFREYHSEPLDYIGVGDSVVVPTRQWGIGRASGAPVEIENTQVYEFRGNQIARVDEYDTLEEALEAARLRE